MDISFLKRSGKPDLAFALTKGGQSRPAVLFCCGFRSDMGGTKAVYLEQQCRMRSQTFLRFDYSGHGRSGGRFEDCVLSDWVADAEDVLNRLDAQPVVIVGSSMGGWIALILALRQPGRFRGLLGIATAPDFTRLIRNALTPDQQARLDREGCFPLPHEYGGDPHIITRALLEDGERHCLLDQTLDLELPVRLVQGQRDADVPWHTARRIRDAMTRPALAEILLVPDGDHRLSRPEDLALIGRQLELVSDYQDSNSSLSI